jgi:hypothetical protein
MPEQDSSPDTAPWQVTDGTIVYGIDGVKLGIVRHYDPRATYLDVQKGWLFPKDFYVPLASVSGVSGEGVYLRLTAVELEHDRYDEPPPLANAGLTVDRPDSGQKTSSADEFVEVRETAVAWDPDSPAVREDEHYEKLTENRYFPSEGLNTHTDRSRLAE